MDSAEQFDPKDYFEKDVKNRLEENASQYFDELVKSSSTDLEANKITYDKILKEEKNDKANEKILNRYKVLNGFLIFIACVGVILLLLGILGFVMELFALTTNIVFITCGAVLTILSVLMIFLWTKKKIKELKNIDDANNKRLSNLYLEATNQLSNLNDSFGFYDFNNIVKRTSNIFSLDDVLDPKKLLLLRDVYGLSNEPNEDESILGVMSGNIKTNPFIRVKVFEKSMFNKVYTGSRTIVWTESVSDGKGGSRLVTRTQTLTAQVVRPAPSYVTACYTIYGNEAAPNLSFSRQPCGLECNPSEKDINRITKDADKKLQKLSEKSISKGGTFQPLANTKFEALFGAIDRDHETQFRLLFTPLAQQNMIEIITKSPYGDDFAFFKRKKINILSSKHGKELFEFNEEGFRSILSGELLKSAFVKTISELYKSLYFELAPLLCVPLYQTTEGGIYNYENELRHVSDYEAESFVNHMDLNRFMPDECGTEQILKIKYDKSYKNTDFFKVTSSAFKTENRVEYISVFGGDGRSHAVPVNWIEYIPITKDSSVAIRSFDGSERDFENLVSSNEFIDNYKIAFSSPARRKKFIGFYNDECYNYDNNFDDILDGIISKYVTTK